MPFVGELASLGCALCWACASILFTRASVDVSALAMNAIKCVVAFALMVATFAVLTGTLWPTQIASGPLLALVASGFLGLSLADTLLFRSLAILGPRRMLLLLSTSAPMTAILAVPVLGEAPTPLTGFAILVTSAGVAWVISERSAGGAPTKGVAAGVVLGLLAALGQAAANVLTKLGSPGLPPLDISVVRMAAGVAGLVVHVLLAGKLGDVTRAFRTPTVAATLVAASFLGTYLGIWLGVTGVRYTNTGVATTLACTSPIFVLPLSAFFLGERISPRAVGGACVAVCGIALLFLAKSG